jgi:hypothetical protein
LLLLRDHPLLFSYLGFSIVIGNYNRIIIFRLHRMQ